MWIQGVDNLYVALAVAALIIAYEKGYLTRHGLTGKKTTLHERDEGGLINHLVQCPAQWKGDARVTQEGTDPTHGHYIVVDAKKERMPVGAAWFYKPLGSSTWFYNWNQSPLVRGSRGEGTNNFPRDDERPEAITARESLLAAQGKAEIEKLSEETVNAKSLNYLERMGDIAQKLAPKTNPNRPQ